VFLLRSDDQNIQLYFFRPSATIGCSGVGLLGYFPYGRGKSTSEAGWNIADRQMGCQHEKAQYLVFFIRNCPK
jgi:hypothetical protein